LRNKPQKNNERLTAVLQDLGFRFNQKVVVYLDNQLIIKHLGRLSPNLAKPQNVSCNSIRAERKNLKNNKIKPKIIKIWI
jgi:hypothetical protein